MKKSLTTRSRILDEGLALASQSGLEGVTLGVLADHVGMSKSGLFAHFRSKDAVQIAVLEEMTRVVEPLVVAPAMRAPAGLPRLRALVGQWFGWSRRAGLPGGCPVAAGMFEYDDVASPVREKVETLECEWRALLSRLVADAVRCGHFDANLDVEQFVWELCGIYLSHHISARFLKSADANRRAIAAFDALVARATPARHRAVPRTRSAGARAGKTARARRRTKNR